MRRTKAKILAISVVVITGILAAGCVGLSNAVSAPVERSSVVLLSDLPSNTKPIRIALLSDIHVGNLAMRPKRLSEIVRRVNASVPDIVLLGGDFVIGESDEGVAERAQDLAPLADLHAPGGVFAVLGNHDHWTDPDAIRRNLAGAGVVVLENSAVRRGPITIVGIGDRFSDHDEIASSVAQAEALGGVPVVLTHSPDIAPDLPKQFPLLFAGHTHCGQMVVPGIGPIVRYSRWRSLYNAKYRCGRIDEPTLTTFVTAGVGPGAVPLRFGAMPDWWLIEIKPRPVVSGFSASRS